MIDAIVQRLKDRVPGLAGRVDKAGALAALMAEGALPRVTPAAHVVPTGIVGGKGEVATGAYRQSIGRQISVALSIRAHDPAGRRALDEIEPLIDAIILALVGWAPARGPGVVGFRYAQLASFKAGMAVYDIAFVLPSQIRTNPA